MITKASILTCDICKKKEIISAESGKSDGWADFFMQEIGVWQSKYIEPSQLCPACARTIKLTVEAMTKEPQI